VAPESGDAEAVLQHGLRVARLVGEMADPASGRALAAAAVLHEIGLFVEDRGHFVVRGARWVAIHLDGIVTDPSVDERRLTGELILFHRHRGALPGGILRPALVDAFRQIEGWDRRGGDGAAHPALPPASIQRAREAHPPHGFPAALLELERLERRRRPRLWRRIERIRRPDR
jgi:hypothetical protein